MLLSTLPGFVSCMCCQSNPFAYTESSQWNLTSGEHLGEPSTSKQSVTLYSKEVSLKPSPTSNQQYTDSLQVLIANEEKKNPWGRGKTKEK